MSSLVEVGRGAQLSSQPSAALVFGCSSHVRVQPFSLKLNQLKCAA